jgi:hypothetical protein
LAGGQRLDQLADVASGSTASVALAVSGAKAASLALGRFRWRLTASIGDDLGTERSPDGISGKITTDSNGRIKNNWQ